jgi:hypothetical protein
MVVLRSGKPVFFHPVTAPPKAGSFSVYFYKAIMNNTEKDARRPSPENTFQERCI